MLKGVRRAGLLFAICFVAVFCSANSAHAANITAKAAIKPSLSLTIPSNTIVMNLDPANHAFDEKSLTISVGTNNSSGYQLMINTAGNTTNLVNNKDATKTISTLSSATSSADFPANYWGIRKTAGTTSSGNYNAFTSPYQVSSSGVPVNNDQTTLGFGAKVDYTAATGSYKMDLDFKVLPIITTYYMQDIATPALANTVCTESPTVVIDKRDEKAYTIVRLADGNCWMASNLDLAGGTTITNTDSNIVAASYTLPASDNGPTSFDDNSIAYVYNSNSTTCGENSPCYSYYSYAAATAGTNPSSGEATSDICPKGWRLPTQAEYTTLINTYATDVPLVPALFNGVYAGFYFGASFLWGGSYGLYWSSTADAASDVYNLYFNSSSTGVNYSGGMAGESIRCVMRDTTATLADISTMQEMNRDIARNTAVGSTKTLKDTRDDRDYTVAKLADGNIWMTSDLNLAGGTTLNASSSDVPSDNYYTLPASETISSGTTLDNSSAFSDNNTAYVFNSGNETASQTDCTSSQPCNSYYSWLSATAGGKDASGNTVTGDGYNTAYSICPKGWRLPTATTSNAQANTNSNWKTGDFYKLATAYGANLESNYVENTATFYNNVGPNTIPNFLLAGYYGSNRFSTGGSNGYYQSSTSLPSRYIYNIGFQSNYLNVANVYNSYYRKSGTLVRCLARS